MTPEYAKKKGFRETEKGIVTWRITKYGTWDKTVRYAPYSKLTIGRDFPTRKKMRERIKGLLYEDLCETEREERMQRRYDDGGRVALEHLEDMRGEMVIHVNWHNPNGIQPFTIKDSNKDYFEDIVKKGWAFYSSKGAKSAAAEENRRERIESCVEHQHSPMTEEQSKDLRGEKYYVVGKRGEVMPTTTIDISAIRDGRAFWHGKDAHAWKQEKVIPSATQVAIEERVKSAPSETPAEKDARIKAILDGYRAKGGPITKEQLTDEVVEYLNRKGRFYYSVDGTIGNDYTGNFDEWDGGPYYWNKPDAEHAKWLADMQSQTTPITPEQAKMLHDYDTVYHPSPIEKPERVYPWPWRKDDACSKECLERGTLYFTPAAAQSALDKAKAEAEPPMWCEYNEGFRLSPEAFISFDDGKTWTTVTGKFIGVCYSERLGIRARYRNPLWLAKHGKDKPCDMPDEMVLDGVKCRRLPDSEQHKDGDIPVDGSQTHRFGSVWYRPVESHETPVGETTAYPPKAKQEADGWTQEEIDKAAFDGRTFQTGAKRDTDAGKPRMDLIPPELLIALGNVFRDGAAHYGEHNWEKGIPLNEHIASLLRHIVAVMHGDHSENHDEKMAANVAMFIATARRIEAGKLPRELDTIGWCGTKGAGAENERQA